MTIASEITRLQGAKSDIRQAIIDKGVDVPASDNIDCYACCIAEISGGGQTTCGCIDVLIVGGGGGGGNGSPYIMRGGGGGGAGGYIEGNIEITAGTYNIVVGEGGRGACPNNYACPPTNGGNSCAFGCIAYGGGHGTYFGRSGSDYCCSASSGGSGGGGGGRLPNGCSGCTGQGNKGGTGYSGGHYVGAGGGGAGTAGCDVSYSDCGSNGGAGKCSCISGECCWYSGGGGGGGYNGGGTGGCGGGGNGRGYCGGCREGDGYPATYYGGGGGGGRGLNNYKAGGAGYQGVVIIRYPIDGSSGIGKAFGGDTYVCGGYVIHCFTSSGTLCVI